MKAFNGFLMTKRQVTPKVVRGYVCNVRQEPCYRRKNRAMPL